MMETIICPACACTIPEGYCCWLLAGRFYCSERCAKKAAGA